MEPYFGSNNEKHKHIKEWMIANQLERIQTDKKN